MTEKNPKGWPGGLSPRLEYKGGLKPLHEYLRDNARMNPEKTALVWYGRELTYRELNDLSDRFAVFLAQLGVQKGERVALFLQNCPQYFIAHYGIQKLGAIVGPCSPMFKEWELEYQVSDLEARVIVAADNLYPIVANVLPQTSLEHIILTGYGDFLPEEPTLTVPEEIKQPKQTFEGTFDLVSAITNIQGNQPPVDVAMDDVALMVYTSGTTGKPKGAMLTYQNALFKTAANTQANAIKDSDILLAVMPVFHIAGMLMGVNIPIYANSTLVLLYRFDPETVLQAVDRYRCTWWYSIAPMNVAIMQLPRAAQYNLTSLKTNIGTSFGISLTKDISDAWYKFTGGCRLFEAAYGLSETHTGDTFMPREAIKWGSHGIPTYETEIRIVDQETGKEQRPGELGEVVISNPGVFKGYWRNPEATAQTLKDGWVYTGDMGFLDADGYFTFCGRYKEMIKVSGYSVFPEDVETMLIKHPAIAQAAVIGVPDNQKGEVVKAYVVLKPDHKGLITGEEIIEWTRERMAAYKYPRYVEFRDALPATGMGKVLRRLLREKPIVSIVAYDDAYRSLRQALELCNGLAGFKPTDKILLKPNLVAWDFNHPFPPFGVVTTSAVMFALVRILYEEGFRNLTIGEGPLMIPKPIGRDMFKVLGYEKLQEQYGVELVDFNEDQFAEVDCGPIKLALAQKALEADKIINLPVLKTHNQCRVSLGLKNLKGCLNRRSKTHCHGKDMELDHTFPHVIEQLPVALTIIDGVYTLAKGPGHSGNAFRKNLLVASTDALACDVVGAELLGYKAGEVEHLRYFAGRQGRSTDLAGIEVRGEDLEKHRSFIEYDWEWTRSNTGPLGFEKRGITGLAIRKYDSSLCTGCSMMYNPMLIMFMSAFKGQPFPNVEVLSGKRQEATPGFDYTVLFGKCACTLNKDNPNIQKAIALKGCPPSLQDLEDGLQEAGITCDYNEYINYRHYLFKRYKKADGFDLGLYLR